MASPIQFDPAKSPEELTRVVPPTSTRSEKVPPGYGIAGIRNILLRGTVSSFGVVIGTAILGFAESVSIARILGQANFGLYALVVSLLNVSVAVASLGFPPAVMKFLSGEASGSRSASEGTIATALHVNILSSIATGSAFGLIGAFLLSPITNSAEGFVLAGAIAAATLGAPFLLFSSALQGQGRIIELNVRSLAAAVLAFGGAVFLSLVFSVGGALAAFALGLFLPGILSVSKVAEVLGTTHDSTTAPAVTLRSLLGYGLPSLSAQLVVLPVLSVVSTMLALYWTLPELGLYAAALTIAGALTFVPSAVSVPLIPLLSSLSITNPKHGRILVPRIMRAVSFTTVPLALLMVSLSAPIFEVAYGPSYSKAASYLSVLAVAMVLLAISGVVGRQLAGSGLVRWTFAINLGWSAVVAAAALGLIPSLGALGASLAVLAGYAFTTLLSWIIGKRVLGIDFEEMRLPAAWTTAFLIAAMGLSMISGTAQIIIGIGLTAAAVSTALLFLHGTEKSLLREALVLVGLARRPSGDITREVTRYKENHRRP